MALPFHQLAAAAPFSAQLAHNQKGMAMDMLGSQANENVLVEQPEAFITQKARVKRNRRTEWDYYVQFPGFPEDEGAWYSARTIKTQHPRGAELIREFEHPDDDATDVTPAPAHQRQPPKPAALPFTQDVGPSQMHPVHDPYAQSQNHQLHTQEQYASQMQQPVEAKLAASSAPTPGFQMHGQHQVSNADMLNTASQNDMQPALHWSFDRMQRAPQFNAQQLLHRPFAAAQAHAPGLSLQNSQAAASIPPRQASAAHQMPGPYMQQPAWGQHAQPSWNSRPQWQQAASFLPARDALMPNQAAAAPHMPSAQTLPMSSMAYQQSAPQQASHVPYAQQQYAPAAQQSAQVQQLHPPQQQQPHAQAHPQSAQHALQAAAHAAAGAQSKPNGQRPLQPGFVPASVDVTQQFQMRQQASTAIAGSPEHHTAVVHGKAPVSTAAEAAAKPEVVSTTGMLGTQQTSQILAQQANQVRQAARQKGSLLLELVPTTAKQLVSKQPTVSSPPHSTVVQQAASPPDLAQQGCETLRGAVQDCIAAAGLPLTKPFYQQAVERALEQHATPARPARAVHHNKNPVRQANQVPGSVAQAQATSNVQPIAAKQEEEAEPMQPIRQLSPGEAMLSDSQDSDLGGGLMQEDDKDKARRYMSMSHWPSAVILGARRAGEALELHINWDDGYDVWLSLEALKRRQHCQSAIIDFLVSKVRKRTKA